MQQEPCRLQDIKIYKAKLKMEVADDSEMLVTYIKLSPEDQTQSFTSRKTSSSF
jgi:hypothetical protein